MKRLFKWIAVALILIVLAILCWLLTLWQRWPAAAAWVLFLSILAGALLTRYLWRKARAWRTRSLEAEPVEKARAAERHPVTLQRQWKAATTLLKHSQLRRFRHPLQVLPGLCCWAARGRVNRRCWRSQAWRHRWICLMRSMTARRPSTGGISTRPSSWTSLASLYSRRHHRIPARPGTRCWICWGAIATGPD
ncbi:hypothetical protein O0544_14520 [Edwardsiella anguillarum]|nr:hypothetical protein [Edwardsiella anguillarum]